MIRGDHSDAPKTHTRIRVRLRPCGLARRCLDTARRERAGAATTTESDTGPPQFEQRELQRQIDKYRHEVWRWQRTMGKPLTRQLPKAPAEVKAKVATWRQVATTSGAEH